MGRLTANLINAFRNWERSARMAFVLAIVLLGLSLCALIYGPFDLRQPVLIGLFGSLITAQVIFMWANRGMVTPYTLAQRRYLAEDFEGARTILEGLLTEEKADVNVLTLLGNTYRQLGLLDESERVVKKAIEIRPFDHFPLYGFGRTLLVMGRYTEAAETINQALEAGAPTWVRFDLGEALYRDAQLEAARTALQAAHKEQQEAFRALMTDYLLYRLGSGGVPARQLLESGLPYWRETALRFRHTPYGQALAADVQDMQTLSQEG